MTTNVYARLVYGFVVLNDDDDEPAEEHPPKWLIKDPPSEGSRTSSIEDIACQFENIQAPPEEYDRSNPEIVQKYETYWDARRNAAKRSGVDLIDHCRAEYPMWILAVEESKHSEWRGDVTHLGQKIEAKPEWREVLETFCERASIPFTEPEWLLAPFSE